MKLWKIIFAIARVNTFCDFFCLICQVLFKDGVFQWKRLENLIVLAKENVAMLSSNPALQGNNGNSMLVISSRSRIPYFCFFNNTPRTPFQTPETTKKEHVHLCVSSSGCVYVYHSRFSITGKGRDSYKFRGN